MPVRLAPRTAARDLLHGAVPSETGIISRRAMSIFEYVVVLTSIVVGLALAHLAQGLATLVQHPGRIHVWWVFIVAMVTRNERVHGPIAVVFLGYQTTWMLRIYETVS
jgi:hypothetical protein